MSNVENTDLLKIRLLSMIGMCRKAGKLTLGSDSVMKAIRASGGKSNGAHAVIISSDASPRTVKQFTDKCSFYGVPMLHADFDSGEIGRAAGKMSAAAVCAVTDKSLAEAVIGIYEKYSKKEDTAV